MNQAHRAGEPPLGPDQRTLRAIQTPAALPQDQRRAQLFPCIGTVYGIRTMGQVHHQRDAAGDRTEIFAYIDAYYNTRRKHSSLAYKTPFQFESNLSQNN